MDIDSSKMRRHENTSSSEEDDLVDLLGNTYQVNKKNDANFFLKGQWQNRCYFGLDFFFSFYGHSWLKIYIISESDGYLL